MTCPSRAVPNTMTVMRSTVVVVALAAVGCRKAPPPAPVDVAVVEPPAWHAVNVARVPSAEPIPRDALVLQLDGEGLRASGGPVWVPAPPFERRAWGFDASQKRSGATDLYLSAFASALRAKLDAGAPSGFVLAVDSDVPYRMVTEVLFTLGQTLSEAEPPRVGLAVAAPDGRRGVLPIQLPRRADVRDRFHVQPDGGAFYTPPGLLALTVLVVPDGLAIKARGGNVSSGCNDVGPGIAIPRPDAGAYDVDAFARCLEKLRAASPEFANERAITFAATPPVPISEVLRVMAAARGSAAGGGASFDEQSLGIAR